MTRLIPKFYQKFCFAVEPIVSSKLKNIETENSTGVTRSRERLETISLLAEPLDTEKCFK